MVDVTVPEVGESITECVLTAWSVEDGAVVERDDPLFELETDKVTMIINADERGRVKILVPAGESVRIGQKVAEIDRDQGSVEKAPAREPARGREPASAKLAIPAGMPQAQAKLDAAQALSPAVRRLVEEYGIDPRTVRGTGKDGRLTKEDVIRHLDRGAEKPRPPGPAPVLEVTKERGAADTAAAPPPGTPPPPEPAERLTRVPMTPIRQRIAERLLEAQQNAAILTTFNEIDLSHVIAWRESLRESFLERYGIKLGFMSFFIKAAVDALKTVPEVGAQIQGDEIVYHNYFDIGIAVGTDRGLVVPVIRDADRLSFGEIETALAELAGKARDKTLRLSDLTGGVFSISNGGIYGNMMSTPILNAPQSGILGMHTIKKRPVVVNDEIVIRPMMYVALSYDHRLVDGREAVTFLRRIVDCIEHPERLLLEI